MYYKLNTNQMLEMSKKKMAEEKKITPEESKAQEYISLANKALNKWKFFCPEKYENAVEFLEKAASQYKVARNQVAAAELYVQAANIVGMDKSTSTTMTDKAQYWLLAAENYVLANNFEQALHYYKLSANLLEEENLLMVAKTWESISRIEENNMDDSKSAIESMKKAKKYYDAGSQTSKGISCLRSVARMYTSLGCKGHGDHRPLELAVETYDELARLCVDNDLLKWHVNDYIFDALLCRLVLGRVDETKIQLEKYAEDYPLFGGRQEHKFFQALLGAVGGRNIPKFIEHVYNYDSFHRLDPVKIKLLLKIKRAAKGTTDGATDDTNASDIDALVMGVDAARMIPSREEKKSEIDDLC